MHFCCNTKRHAPRSRLGSVKRMVYCNNKATYGGVPERIAHMCHVRHHLCIRYRAYMHISASTLQRQKPTHDKKLGEFLRPLQPSADLNENVEPKYLRSGSGSCVTTPLTGVSPRSLAPRSATLKKIHRSITIVTKLQGSPCPKIKVGSVMLYTLSPRWKAWHPHHYRRCSHRHPQCHHLARPPC